MQHKKFTSIQEKIGLVLSNLPADSPGQTDIPSLIEELQDHWDFLISIIEAQSRRVSCLSTLVFFFLFLIFNLNSYVFICITSCIFS